MYCVVDCVRLKIASKQFTSPDLMAALGLLEMQRLWKMGDDLRLGRQGSSKYGLTGYGNYFSLFPNETETHGGIISRLVS
jgi:hypothetical protein